MAGTESRGSAVLDRRLSVRFSTQLDHGNSDHDLDVEAMGISDGFRPSGAGTGHDRIVSQVSASRNPPPRPSGTTNPPAPDSFALQHDGATGTEIRTNSTISSSTNPPMARSSSGSTDIPYVRSESPYQGPAQPSHPYQMYPQESQVTRTASMATTSTVPVSERSYTGPSGPTHPYGMYAQNITPEREAAESSRPTPPVAVGFPGLNNHYQRRLGPDGEEVADIIGPDGHTEQLPPYTQYPDEALARKTRPNVAVPPAPVPGAGGIGLATRNPEFASQEDLSSPQSRRSIMSDMSSHQVNTAAAVVSEKPALKNWQKAARRKVCGIVPVWVLALVALVFIMFGIILGTVLAILKPKRPPSSKHYSSRPNPESESTIYTTMTTTFDATPLTAVPTGMPPLPTGTFAVPISVPALNQASCIQDTAQSNAWACGIAFAPGPLQITVAGSTRSSNPLENNEVNLSYGNNSLNSFTYGAQAPTLSESRPLKLVTDVTDAARGPAWWFQMPYDKLVVLHENNLAPLNKRREGKSHEPSDWVRKGVAVPGDSPWFCYWNGTILEAFIYVNQTSSWGSKSSPIPSGAPSSTTGSEQSSTYSTSVPTSSNAQTDGPSSRYGPPTPPYPKVVKIEEHRMSRGPRVSAPYCVQHKINADNSATPVLNSTGQPITVYLNETESTNFGRRYVDLNEKRADLSERDFANKCGCVWLYS
ncbi:uncharacterized protein BP5553_01986 [Venustampulla echinocandica]|uniref:DUF7820 domain-containing protein n=1 Tax=Venustampulla echinocandica TaxID=2656787 RepID=A0A370U2J9_9HELO|nr:uncharacterized protein BP5553_01986 [Venustampulla echinocandica]RDL42007.1 hypothetical protein BP5553_01986 [Venustampulla echinocandica]